MAQVMYNVWLDKHLFDDAERVYQEHLQMMRTGGCSTGGACSSVAHQTTVSIHVLCALLLNNLYLIWLKAYVVPCQSFNIVVFLCRRACSL